MVRQIAAESRDGFFLRIDTPAEVWTNPIQFELLCSFAGTLAEDLFATGRLQGMVINGGPPCDIRRARDVEAFLDSLARLQPIGQGDAALAFTRSTQRGEGIPQPSGKARNVITFAPEGARGVTAYVDGIATASA